MEEDAAGCIKRVIENYWDQGHKTAATDSDLIYLLYKLSKYTGKRKVFPVSRTTVLYQFLKHTPSVYAELCSYFILTTYNSYCNNCKILSSRHNTNKTLPICENPEFEPLVKD